MPKPFRPETRSRYKWSVTIYAGSEGVGFYTECISPKGAILRTEICNDKGSAWQQGYNLVDRAIQEELTNRYNTIAIPLTLALLYVSGWDEEYELGHQSCLRVRRAWKGHDFQIMNLLTERGWLEEQRNPKQIKSVVLTPKGIKQARHILKNLNLEGIEEFFQTYDNCDDLIDELEQEKEQLSDE
ncbi:MAG: hypothetical protein HC849_11125 [Oscillatoriales cyanobacterium RU_3_3]|nr:hypothetical protein [Microcoleus sp. SU_5_3]NJM60624.1 hypothetical protein [Oscillatoriales cyanobacterium RU_3_3]